MREPEMGKGVLNPKRAQGKFFPQRFLPPPELSDFVEHFWQVEWHLPNGETFVQHTIPFPSVHVVFERGRTEVVGPITGRFTRELTGRGRVVGAHIKPGMFSAFTELAVGELVDRRASHFDVMSVSRADEAVHEDAILALKAEHSARYFADCLRGWKRPAVPAACWIARDLVNDIETDAELTQSEQLAAKANMSVRSLQRLFKQHVGLSPKFVIQRFRLLEASARLAEDPASGSQLALDPGVPDQAHYIRAFKNLVGETPDRYAKRNA